MKYSIILSIVSCLLPPPSRWFPEYPKHHMRFGQEQTVDRLGNVYIVTLGCDPNTGFSYQVSKYDSIGRNLWQRMGPNVSGSSTSFTVASADGAGNVYCVFGTHIGLSDGTVFGCVINKHSPQGQQLWSAPSEAGEIEMLRPVHALTDNKDNFYVVGFGGTPAVIDINDEDNWFDDACGSKAKTRAAQQERRSENIESFWEKRSSYGTSDVELVTIKYNPGGRKLWTTRYGRRWNWVYWPIDAEVDTNSNLYVVGRADGPNSSKLLIIKYDENGKRLWDTQYAQDDESNYYPAGAVLDATGHLYVVASVQTERGPSDLFIGAYDSQGNQEWTTTYREQERDYVSPCAVTVDLERNVYVTILTCMSPWKPDTWDEVEPVKGVFTTLKYDREGKRQWATKYKWPRGRKMWIHELVVDQASHLHALGFSGSEPIAIEYDENGSRQSVRHFRDLPAYVRFLSDLKHPRIAE